MLVIPVSSDRVLLIISQHSLYMYTTCSALHLMQAQVLIIILSLWLKVVFLVAILIRYTATSCVETYRHQVCVTG